MENDTSANQESEPKISVFVNWVALTEYSNGKFTPQCLREVVNRFGSMGWGNVYGNWSEYPEVKEELMKYDFSCISPPKGLEMLPDMRLMSDCHNHARYSTKTFLITLSEENIPTLVGTLKSRGKQVIVLSKNAGDDPEVNYLLTSDFIGATSTEEVQEEEVQDITKVIVDTLKEIVRGKEQPEPEVSPVEPGIKDVKQIFIEIGKIIHRTPRPLIPLNTIKPELIKVLPDFNENDYGFDKFKDLLQEGCNCGYFNMSATGGLHFISMGEKGETLLSSQNTPPVLDPSQPLSSRQVTKKQKDELSEIFEKILEIVMQAIEKKPTSPGILLAQVRPELDKYYGKFNHLEYGFAKFKPLAEAGVKAGYFSLKVIDNAEWLCPPNHSTS